MLHFLEMQTLIHLGITVLVAFCLIIFSLCAILIYRLLSWAGKSIEPYGVDYILQKLGFSHARTTIPKWMQRGFMDPLDKVLAVLMLRMITVVREEPPASEGDSNRKRTDGK